MNLSGLWTNVRTMAWNLLHRQDLLDALDILLVAVIIYQLLKLTSHTRGSAVLKGMVFLVLVVLFSNVLGLVSLNWILMAIVSNGAVVLVVLFQPELRKALEQVGNTRVFNSGKRSSPEHSDRIVGELVQCVLDLSKLRIGALIVIERKTGLKDIMETGKKLDAEVSAPLLEQIFVPNTPLHDGAVIISGDRIVSAACILPLTESRGVSLELGTRHRAGLGLSETTDALVLIVSEETGTISIASKGNMTRHLDQEQLQKTLDGIYTPPIPKLIQLIRSFAKKEEF